MDDHQHEDPRPLRLDDLPPEILASIVAHCEGGDATHDEDPEPATTTTTTTATVAAAPGSQPSPSTPPSPSPPPRDLATIRNLRLTNRLLAALAAPHLVRVLDVSMTPASLARLDAVSRHPTVAPGVRRLRLSLATYPAPLAADPAEFTRFAVRTLLAEAARADRAARLSTADLAKHRARVQEWMRPAAAPSPFLGDAFAEYARRREAHAGVRAGFGAAVARAMARMRHATALEVNDKVAQGPRGRWHARHPPRREDDALVDERALAELLALPMPWEDAAGYAWGAETTAAAGDHHPVEALRELLADLGRLDVRLTRLVVDLTPPARYHGLACADDAERAHITHAVRGVRSAVLALRPGNEVRQESGPPAWPPRGPTELAALGSFASAALASEALEDVDLDFGALRRENQDLWALDAVLGAAPRGWRSLRRLALRGACLAADDLAVLVGERLTSLTLCVPHLTAGSWAEVLEMLRGRADPARTRDAGDAPLELDALTSPTGGEAETMTGAQYDGVFSQPRGWALYEAQMNGEPVLSAAVRFVSHLQAENPVRAVL